ncbi:MAG: B12-binding domain-containing radical SAM protein [Desulfamplus sp.]|nr:B12-binding domain-containing radical SAM protein [Desulfamplus sp.]
MVDILLIQPPVEDFYFTHKRSIPWGLASIAASLRFHGFSVEILDCLAVAKSKKIPIPHDMDYLVPLYGKSDISLFSLFHEFRHYGYSFEYVGKIVRDKKPFLVGISSLFTPYWHTAQECARYVKKFLPDCFVVMGGHHPTVLPETVMESPCVDFLLRGDGEVSMPVLARKLISGEDVMDVPGVVARKNGDLGLHISQPAWIDDLDAIPLPDTSLYNHRFYRRKKRGSTVVVAGRGCPMPCTYCSVGSSSCHGPFRQRRVESVLKELELQIFKYDIGFIDFEDENLTLNRKWFLELMDGITSLIQGRDVELRAMNGLYPPSLDMEMIKSMKKAGFKTLNLSLGTVSPVQLGRFRRKNMVPDFERVLGMASQCSLDTVSYIIAGAPGQSPWDSLGDILYLASKPTLVGLSIFYPAPGSVDYGVCLEKGLLPANFSLMRSSALPINNSTTRLQSATLMRLARIVNFMKSIESDLGWVPSAMPIGNISSLPPSLMVAGDGESLTKGGDGKSTLKDGSFRKDASLFLLGFFLYDGIIRGVDGSGEVFPHLADMNLTGRFIERIKDIKPSWS